MQDMEQESDELKTFLFVRRNPGLEKHGVRPVLRVQQRHVAVHLAEEVDALVALLQTEQCNIHLKIGDFLSNPWKWESSSDRETGQPGQRNVQREVTCTAHSTVLYVDREGETQFTLTGGC